MADANKNAAVLDAPSSLSFQPTASLSAPIWPPQSLLLYTDIIIDECENYEVSSGQQEQDLSCIVVVHMAALLVKQNLVEARHHWKRYRDNPTLECVLRPWWQVAVNMLQRNVPDSLAGLENLAKALSSSPLTPAFALYANEIAYVYRLHLLNNWLHNDIANDDNQKGSVFPKFALDALGFASPADLKDFCVSALTAFTLQPDIIGENMVPKTSLVQILSFLESRVDV